MDGGGGGGFVQGTGIESCEQMMGLIEEKVNAVPTPKWFPWFDAKSVDYQSTPAIQKIYWWNQPHPPQWKRDDDKAEKVEDKDDTLNSDDRIKENAGAQMKWTKWYAWFLK